MGKLAETFRGVSLSLDKKRQVLALDHEFEDLKSQEQALAAANAKLQAEVVPARRKVEIHKPEIEHGEDSIAEITENILIALAASDISQASLIKSMGLTSDNGNRHFDALLGKKYIIQSHAGIDGVFYRATAEGRAYLARDNKL